MNREVLKAMPNAELAKGLRQLKSDFQEGHDKEDYTVILKLMVQIELVTSVLEEAAQRLEKADGSVQ